MVVSPGCGHGAPAADACSFHFPGARGDVVWRESGTRRLLMAGRGLGGGPAEGAGPLSPD